MDINKEKLRREFSILIDRCGCSRAGTYITQKDADDMNAMDKADFPNRPQKWNPTPPRCTPHNCFPDLMKLLYPNGGFHKKSNMYHNNKVWYERKREEENNS